MEDSDRRMIVESLREFAAKEQRLASEIGGGDFSQQIWEAILNKAKRAKELAAKFENGSLP